jgi:hypothetical protein
VGEEAAPMVRGVVPPFGSHSIYGMKFQRVVRFFPKFYRDEEIIVTLRAFAF